MFSGRHQGVGSGRAGWELMPLCSKVLRSSLREEKWGSELVELSLAPHGITVQIMSPEWEREAGRLSNIPAIPLRTPSPNSFSSGLLLFLLVPILRAVLRGA